VGSNFIGKRLPQDHASREVQAMHLRDWVSLGHPVLRDISTSLYKKPALR